MGRHEQNAPGRSTGRVTSSTPTRAHRLSRARAKTAAVFAFGAAMSFLLVNAAAPYSAVAETSSTAQGTSSPVAAADLQRLDVTGSDAPRIERADYTVKSAPKPPPPPEPRTPAPPASAPAPDPGSAKDIAYSMLKAQGMGDDQFSCLVALWNRESHWNVYAHNSSSGAYGIPQAMPGSKMASAGPDWQSNPETQVRWGLGYVNGRYGSPCGAWAHSESAGWY